MKTLLIVSTLVLVVSNGCFYKGFTEDKVELRVDLMKKYELTDDELMSLQVYYSGAGLSLKMKEDSTNERSFSSAQGRVQISKSTVREELKITWGTPGVISRIEEREGDKILWVDFGDDVIIPFHQAANYFLFNADHDKVLVAGKQYDAMPDGSNLATVVVKLTAISSHEVSVQTRQVSGKKRN